MKKWYLIVRNVKAGIEKRLDKECVYASSLELARDKFTGRIDTICHGKYSGPDWTWDVEST